MSSEKDIYEIAALGTLFKRFYKPLRTYAFRFVNDTDLAEDIVLFSNFGKDAIRLNLKVR